MCELGTKPSATLDGEARRQGQRAERKRTALDEQMRAGQGVEQVLPPPGIPFTLIIELDARHIRERDDWGCTTKVLAVADGAVWIWNLTGDRFPQARQRLDYCHASEHLWAVARWNRPAGNINVGFTDPASFGRPKAMRR